MAEKILMTALSPTMQEGVISSWLVEAGQAIKQGDVICEVETDKATMEYESPQEGTILKVLAKEGQSIPIGKPIAIIGDSGEDISKITAEPQPEPSEAGACETAQPEALKPEKTETAKIRSTPLARSLARERGVEIAGITGTGPAGRITEKDVKNAAVVSKPLISAKEEVVEATQKRKAIAKTLTASKFTAPHYYLTLTAVADALMEVRKQINAGQQERISLNAFLIKLTAETLRNHPVINSTWKDNKIIKHRRIDIALAVSPPQGLITPVVRDCLSKGVIQIDRQLKLLVEKAETDRLQPEEFSDSTFTISNLGSFGIEQFTGIINPPNSALLAIGKITSSPVVGADKLQNIKTMKLTLSCDHRIIDGVPAANFLNDLKQTIQNPIKAIC